ncbi:MAG TPA: thioredoxin family protein [Burkholderiales bacterium]
MTTEHQPNLAHHPVVSEKEWQTAARDLLKQEKELTRARDELARRRRALPWVKVTKPYTFDTSEGKKTLADLFEGRSQLIVQHFMFAPEWDEGCSGCSFMADGVDGARQHFNHNDVTYVAISRAPLPKLLAYRQRMGWTFPWASSGDGDFNYDFHASFRPEELKTGHVTYNYNDHHETKMADLPGCSVFYKDAQGQVFHTYSMYGRGTEAVMSTYPFLDMLPKGRAENGPGHNMGDWMRHHDKYEAADAHACCGGPAPVLDQAAKSACGCDHDHEHEHEHHEHHEHHDHKHGHDHDHHHHEATPPVKPRIGNQDR